jgi:hypothetical protein
MNHNVSVSSLKKIRQILLFTVLLLTLPVISPDVASSQQVFIEAEAGGTWFSQNDIRIPNEGGTGFDMLELIGTDAVPYYRLRLNTTFSERHTVRVLFAPLSKIGTGSFDEEIFFEETTFEAGIPIDGTYRFNTYRLTYRYTFYDRNNWTLGAGAAGLVRDAKVELIQPGRSDSSTDLGFVPLVHLYAERHFGNIFSAAVDAETLAGPQGRATDAAFTLNFRLTENWSLNTGYRVLEGGADVDDVYNFSWINFVSAGFRLDI